MELLRAVDGVSPYWFPGIILHDILQGRIKITEPQPTKPKVTSMKTTLLLSATVLLAGSLPAADSKDDIAAAVKKLGEQANYSWTTTVVVPEGSRFRPGPTEGKTEKDGFTQLSVTMNDNTTQAVLKGDKAAINSPENGWQSLAELENAEGAARFRAMAARNFKAPTVLAAELAAGAKTLAKDGDALSGELKEDVAGTLLTFGRRAGGDGPTVSNAKGSVKFWLKDGALVKYEIKVSGKVSFNGNERDVERTMTTEIKDVGSTKVEVPEEAKKKLS